MGLSSNARLLSITARITGNEYEAQQISNSKMRLAIESQQVSEKYIKSLNTQKLMFQSYNANGDAVTYDLTPSFLYQYADNKNQYILSNISGQALVSKEINDKFANSNSLDEFLQSYGVLKKWKTPTLEENYRKLSNESSDNGVKDYASIWEEKLEEVKNRQYYYKNTGTDENPDYDVKFNLEESDTGYTKCDAETAWYFDANKKYNDYTTKYNEYIELENKYNTKEKSHTIGVTDTTDSSDTTKEQVDAKKLESDEAKAEYMQNYFKYDSWVEKEARESFKDEYANYQKYLEVASEFQAEIDALGGNESGYDFNDATKARWYTNLWYRLNGESSEKSFIGENGSNFVTLEENLITSSTWLKDALANGNISIEMAKYEETSNIIPDSKYPNIVNLRGISWDAKIYSSCSDIIQADDKVAVSVAEAEYESKMTEIDAKDRKYENQIKSLETEHAALDKEYSSVQEALKNSIKNSFNTFKG